jgi:hypothetical protein
MIISVGYRVKSNRGFLSALGDTGLKEYTPRGYAVRLCLYGLGDLCAKNSKLLLENWTCERNLSQN